MRELAEELDVDLSHDKLPDPELDMIKTLLIVFLIYNYN